MSKFVNQSLSCGLGIVGVLIAAGGSCMAVLSGIATSDQGLFWWLAAAAGIILSVGALIAFVREASK